MVFIFFAIVFNYVVKFPHKDEINLNDETDIEVNLKSNWDDYTSIDQIDAFHALEVFATVEEKKKIQLHRNFLKKIQMCINLNLSPEVEAQLVYNLTKGASREAVLRGMLSRQEVYELIDRSQTSLLGKELVTFVENFNKNFLQRDDFELPPDMREYELKVALMEEFLSVADTHITLDSRKFYLWAAYILNNINQKVNYFNDNKKIIQTVINIPVDHLKTEIPLAICIAIDEISKKDDLSSATQNP